MPQMREKFKIVRKSHEDLRALTTSPQYDDAKAKALADAGARAMADIALLKARSEHDIYALLTPEQKAQAEKNQQNFLRWLMSTGERGGRGMQGNPGAGPR
jgi:Spy/CpxP family protein refolding chaperone